jgi:hypothetical protein
MDEGRHEWLENGVNVVLKLRGLDSVLDRARDWLQTAPARNRANAPLPPPPKAHIQSEPNLAERTFCIGGCVLERPDNIDPYRGVLWTLGRVNENVEPSLGVLSAVSSPPITRARSRLIASPNPVPPMSAV